MESVWAAVDEIKDGWKEWLQVEDGFMLYKDFTFATDALFKEYQRLIDRDNEIRSVNFGSCYGTFPRTVRTYYPLLHQKYPLHEYQKARGELADLVNGKKKSKAPVVQPKKKLVKAVEAPKPGMKGEPSIGKEEQVVQMIGSLSKSRSSRQVQRWIKRNQSIQPYKPVKPIKATVVVKPIKATVVVKPVVQQQQDDESEFVDIDGQEDGYVDNGHDEKNQAKGGDNSIQKQVDIKDNKSQVNNIQVETDDDFLFYVFEHMFLHTTWKERTITDDIIARILEQKVDVLGFCKQTFSYAQWQETTLYACRLGDADLCRLATLIGKVDAFQLRLN